MVAAGAHLPNCCLQAQGTQNARAQSQGGQFGEGYHFGANTAKATTIISKVAGDANRVVPADDTGAAFGRR